MALKKLNEELKNLLEEKEVYPQIKLFPKNSEEYKKLEEAAELLAERLNYDIKVEDIYFDFGQKWLWTTLVANKKGNDTEWQLIDPAQQKEILFGDLHKAVNDIAKGYLKKDEDINSLCDKIDSAEDELNQLKNLLTPQKQDVNENEYEVFGPEEEARAEKAGEKVHRSKFDSQDIRNIMISYFQGETAQDVINNIKTNIDSMPDSWVIEFLKNQPDTEINEL